VWLEHVYDAVFLAMRDKKWLCLAENTINVFIDNQSECGQLPFSIMDAAQFVPTAAEGAVRYSHVQEVVSFAKLGFAVYEMNQDKAFLSRLYEASKRWVEWYKSYRMTTGKGLVEMFVGFDTGHDNSPRLNGMSYKGRQWLPMGLAPAEAIPDDEVAPIIAVDMSCNMYASLIALSKMADELGEKDASLSWLDEAKALKERLVELCYDREDSFFYDIDKHGNKRKYKSSTIFHLFMEGVLDMDADKDIINDLYVKHISNPEEFATPYPYPSMAINDPSTEGHATFNCWGYYSQALTAFRCTMWMDKYGYGDEFDRLCRAFIKAWCENYGKVKIAQEIDPITGEPTNSSEWYSSSMIFYLYAVDRLIGKN
jgi:hypothetical protein